MAPNQNLLDLVPEHLKPLTPLEEKLLEVAPLGHEASLFLPNESIDITQIGDAQSVRSELLVWLLTDREARERIHHKGINIRGAKLVGVLDLEDSSIENPLRLRACNIEEEMVLGRGKYKDLDFSGSLTGPIIADSIKVQHNVLMKEGFKAKGEVRLLGANIGGSLVCIGGEFENPDGNALSGDRLTTKGGVFLGDGFRAKGEVRLPGANIGGDLDCGGGEFENPNGFALSGDGFTTQGDVFLSKGFKAKGEVRLLGVNIGSSLVCIGGEFENHDGNALSGDRLTTKGGVFLGDGFRAKGEVRLPGANIGCNLDCGGGEFENPNGFALSGDGLTTQGDVFLSKGFKAKGEVRLLGANIGGDLDCGGGEFENHDGNALSGDRLTTKGGVFLGDGFRAKGEVRLPGANIGGDLDCSNGEFKNSNGRALLGDSLTTQANVFLRDGFKAKGEVRLPGANIGGDLDCGGGEFENPNGFALSGDGLTTQGDVFLGKGFKAKGEVRLNRADIGGNLECWGGEFENPDGYAFWGKNMKVHHSFYWRELKKKLAGKLSLENANIANLYDDENNWPESGNLDIDGFTYGLFTTHVPADSKTRLRWLNLRNPESSNVQPYEQLISVFQRMGLHDDARDVAIAKQRFIHKQRKGLSRFWSWFLSVTIDYGYRPHKVILLFILPIIFLGILVFGWAFSGGLMEPTSNQQILQSGQTVSTTTNPKFDPVGYSVDVFLPIVDLHQEDAWKPNLATAPGIIVLYYMYFQILAGWFFTTIAVAAVTGLIRRE